VSVRRPDDFLIFDLHFHGFTLAEHPLRIERASSDPYIVVEFPPQAFGEQAYLEVAPEVSMEPNPPDDIEVTSHPGYPDKNVNGGNETPPAALPSAHVRMAGPSRIAVSMLSDVNSIGFDLPSMLGALRDWPMRLDFNAVPDPPGALVGIDLRHGPNTVTELVTPQAMATLEAQALVPLERPASATASGEVAAAAAVGLVELPIDVALRPFLLGPHEPAANVTALELPYRLMVSPLEPAGWIHREQPASDRGRTELWHTRLSTSKDKPGADRPSRIRALWSPDYHPQDELDELIALITVQPEPPGGPAPNPDLLRMSLDPVDRSMLVTLMAGFDATRGSGLYRPLSSEAKRLHLSALGALVDVEGTWTNLPDQVDLQQWRHLATLGRDHYVRVMYAGYLCPFGNAASLVKVTERRFESMTPDSPERVALLRQRFFIVVREPVRFYTGAGHEHDGNNFPFRRVEILTRVTPDLSEPGAGVSGLATSPPHGLAPRMVFWPMVPGGPGQLVDVPFRISLTDLAGNRTTLSVPLLFVGKLADDSKAISDSVIAGYNAAPDAKRKAATGASVVAYAPFDETDKGDPRLPTKSITFGAGKTTGKGPRFYPEVSAAEVGVKPIQKLLSQPGFVVEVTYPDFFKKNAFDPIENAAQIFLKLTKHQPLTFGGTPNAAKSDALGALATPQLNLLALSKVIGPVGGEAATDADAVESKLTDVKKGQFDPLRFFSDAKILGGVGLQDIVGIKHNLGGSDVPKMLTQDFPDRVEASFHWNTDVDSKNALLVANADSGKPPTRLTMEGVVRTPHDPGQPASFNASATLNNFKVNLFGFIILWFEQLIFVAKNGQKPDVTVELRNGEDAVQFGGPLEFVNALRKYIPSNGFSDPPGLSVTPSGISASYSLTLPAIEVGVFALSNASLGAAFSLPFDSKPASVKFNFSERQQPFCLTVSLLGGGGFFAIGVSAEGVNEIEAALEFGAAIAINLGVASGGVEVKAGVYFHWLQPTPGKGTVELAGYVRIHGELTVIAIISVSLTFNLQLGYLKEGGKSSMYGEATLVVEIEILMFSTSVSVSCRKEFAGGEADPKFIDLIPTQQVWTDYCEAFADETDF